MGKYLTLSFLVVVLVVLFIDYKFQVGAKLYSRIGL